jgi:hypothetical protein
MSGASKRFEALVKSWWTNRAQEYRDRAVFWVTPDKKGRYPNEWSRESCEREALCCQDEAVRCDVQALEMPVKIVVTYEDGTEETFT